MGDINYIKMDNCFSRKADKKKNRRRTKKNKSREKFNRFGKYHRPHEKKTPNFGTLATSFFFQII